MKLLILGQAVGDERHFFQRALRSGYEVSLLTPSSVPSTQFHSKLAISCRPFLTETGLLNAIQGADAIVVTARHAQNHRLIQTLTNCMDVQNIRRLIVIVDGFNYSKLIAYLRSTSLDWTILHNCDQELEPTGKFKVSISDFAAFVVSQITEVKHLRAAVLVTS